MGGIAPPFFDVPPFRLSRVHLAISSLIRINPTQGQVPAKSCKYWFIFTNMRISNPTTLRPTYFWHLQFPSIWTYKQHTKNISIPNPWFFTWFIPRYILPTPPWFFPNTKSHLLAAATPPAAERHAQLLVGHRPPSKEGFRWLFPAPDPEVPPKREIPKPQKVGIYVGYHHHPQQSLERYIVRGTPVPWFIRRLSEYIR